MNLFPKDPNQKIKGRSRNRQVSVSKEGFLQNRDFDGFQIQARICARYHLRNIPSTPSNLSLKENPINSASNQESRNSSKEPNFHEQKRERGRRWDSNSAAIRSESKARI
jgi:hypothetical protein